MKRKKIFNRILAGAKDIRFEEMVFLAEGFGFIEARVSGSHHIFTHKDIRELLNLQEVDGQVKPYQVRQFLKLVERYNLQLGDEL